jgi:hypothetical protein
VEDNIKIDLTGSLGPVKNRNFLHQLSVCSFCRTVLDGIGVTICTRQFERIKAFAWSLKSQCALATHSISNENRVAGLLTEVLDSWVVSGTVHQVKGQESFLR